MNTESHRAMDMQSNSLYFEEYSGVDQKFSVYLSSQRTTKFAFSLKSK